MKLLQTLLQIILFLGAVTLQAQNSQWTWVGGDSNLATGSYGIKGIVSATNHPDARQSGVTWQDSIGNLWLFGGAKTSIATYSNQGIRWGLPSNDMWKWDGRFWTWINGGDSTNQFEYGNFGTRGITASSNLPAGRFGAQSWYDNNGILWLFGGMGTDSFYTGQSGTAIALNDLWKWDGVNWTWVKGRTNGTVYIQGTYGIKGVADSANNPRGLTAASGWTDKNGNLWMYGGSDSHDPFAMGGGTFNDLWKWDGKNWTWIKGDIFSGVAYPPAIYGTIGKPDTANTPGGRAAATIWKDSSDNAYLFGGYYTVHSIDRYGSSYRWVYFNDFWKWDGNNWVCLSGSNLSRDNLGNYGIKGISAATNLPSARAGAASWTDVKGNFWLYGGYGVNGSYNDLWVWDGKYWTWIGGDSTINAPGVYGTKGFSEPNNKPGARKSSLFWTDKKNNAFWLFGGLFLGQNPRYFNDFWKFSPGIVTAISPSPSLLNFNSRLLLLNNPSPLDQFQFLSDQFYQKLNWQIIDENGRMLQEGKLFSVLKGSFQMVTTHHLNNGNYFIRFLGEGKKLQTLKWIKQ